MFGIFQLRINSDPNWANSCFRCPENSFWRQEFFHFYIASRVPNSLIEKYPNNEEIKQVTLKWRWMAHSSSLLIFSKWLKRTRLRSRLLHHISHATLSAIEEDKIIFETSERVRLLLLLFFPVSERRTLQIWQRRDLGAPLEGIRFYICVNDVRIPAALCNWETLPSLIGWAE